MADRPSLGILMLDTQFPRPVGDIGNAASFRYPVLYRIVKGASAERVVRGDSRALLSAFIDSGRALISEGAVAITTSCGFLSVFQGELERALGVPVAASSLVQVPAIENRLGAVGILTIDARALSPAHLRAAGVSETVPIEGLSDDGALATTIFNDRGTLDETAAKTEMIEAGRRLIARDPGLAAIVLECTNMGPYAGAVSRATGVPVFSIIDAADTLMEPFL